jgi:hypothetical protein
MMMNPKFAQMMQGIDQGTQSITQPQAQPPNGQSPQAGKQLGVSIGTPKMPPTLGGVGTPTMTGGQMNMPPVPPPVRNGDTVPVPGVSPQASGNPLFDLIMAKLRQQNSGQVQASPYSGSGPT